MDPSPPNLEHGQTREACGPADVLTLPDPDTSVALDGRSVTRARVGRVPPWWSAVLASMKAGDADAAREVKGWKERRAAQDFIVSALLDMRVGEVMTETGVSFSVDPGELPADAVRNAMEDNPWWWCPEDDGPSDDLEHGEPAPVQIAMLRDGRIFETEEVVNAGQVEHKTTVRTARASVASVDYGKASQTVYVDGRELRHDWLADPQRAARKMTLCSTAATVREHGASMLRCHHKLCPQCAHFDGAARADELLEQVSALVDAGCPVVHLTLTQPTREDVDGRQAVLAPWERGLFPGARVAEGADGYATPGETLSECRDRLYESWRTLCNGRTRKAADAWESVIGGTYGTEFTGRRREGVKGARVFALRWHGHMHVLLVLRPGTPLRAERVFKRGRARWAVRGAWVDQVREAWCDIVPGAQPDAQEVTLVAAPGTTVAGAPDAEREEVRRALREVLKYPVKVGELTAAQLVEFLSVMKGAKTAMPFGALHGQSKVGRVALAIRHGLLEVQPPTSPATGLAPIAHDGTGWRLYTGAPPADNDAVKRWWRAVGVVRDLEQADLRTAMALGGAAATLDARRRAAARSNRTLWRLRGDDGWSEAGRAPAVVLVLPAHGPEHAGREGGWAEWVPLLVSDLRLRRLAGEDDARCWVRARDPDTGRLVDPSSNTIDALFAAASEYRRARDAEFGDEILHGMPVG